MRNFITIFVILVIVLHADITRSQEMWVGKDGNIRNVDSRAMVIDENGLYLATKNEVYRAVDMKSKWEPIFSFPAGENEIRCLAGRGNNIFIGTRRGLLRSQDRGKTWKNVFRTILPEKNNILAMEISRYNPKKVLIGTERGVFISENSGDKWENISDNLKDTHVRCIALNKNSIYAGGDGGLYYKESDRDGWERIYVLSAAEENTEEAASDPVYTEEEINNSVNCITLKGARLYLGLSKRILYSDDAGKSWNDFSHDGLAGNINHILAARESDKLYCATTKGVFEFSKDKAQWLELYKGMDKVLPVTKLVLGGEKEESLWALTENGLYHLEGGRYVTDQFIDIERNLKSLKIMFDNEPSFKELQQAALRFAELDPDKITRWRTQARLKAFVPKVSLGWDNNVASNSEIYTSGTRDYVVVGPDDISEGLDVSVSWELGDLIWSDDQTSIDVRSRLTTQLRNDVLDDLRRTYYERKRLQFELMQSPPADLKARFDKELRIQELTQAIDDLTGNYLSEHIKKTDEEAI